MIKDSKLIGTKIAAPYGWKKFKVGELFEVCTTTGFDAGKLVFSNEGTPFIGRTDNNYGFQGYVNGMFSVNSNPANVISISQIGSQSAQYRKESWYASQNMFYVELLDRNLTLYVGLFFVSIFNKLLEQYSGYTSYPTKNSIFDWIIDLPITSANKPDFEWMSVYIKAVKADYLEQKELSNQREIKDYLTAGKVDSMDVTDADRQFLRDFEKLPRRKFKLCELFVPVNPKRYDLKISDIIDNNGNTIVISSTTVNQGIKGYSSMKPLVKANKIVYSDAVGPSMMFYQERDFIADAHVKYLKPRFTVNMSKNMALYLITCIQKSTFGVYSYGNKYNNDAVNNTIIELPVIDSSQVDVHSIEKYMQIQSKPLINKVAETLAPVGGGEDFN